MKKQIGAAQKLLTAILFLGTSLWGVGFASETSAVVFNTPSLGIPHAAGEIIVKIKPSVSFTEVAKTYQLKVLASGKRLSTDSSDEALLARTLTRMRRDPRVIAAEPNYLAFALGAPNDPDYQYQWHLRMIGVESAWEFTKGTGAVVGVVDTGIAYETAVRDGKAYFASPDFAGTHFLSGYDFVNGDSFPNDDNGHGTHIAGTIAEAVNNGVAGAGIAPFASLLPIKVLNRYGAGTYADIADGIRYGADHGASVINLSLGGSVDSFVLRDAVSYALDRGVALIAAAGNSGTGQIFYPAAYARVISVGAVDARGLTTRYSNYGVGLTLTAPGGDTRNDYTGDGVDDGIAQMTMRSRTRLDEFETVFAQGTSMAAAHVTGVAALVYAQGAHTGDEIRRILTETANDAGEPGWDSRYGYGIIDAVRALGITGSSGSPSPLPTPTPVPTNTPPSQASSLGASVTTSKSEYDFYEQVPITVSVYDGVSHLALSGVAIELTLLTPRGKTLAGSATSNAEGEGAFLFKTRRTYGEGLHLINITASLTGRGTTSTSTTFVVRDLH